MTGIAASRSTGSPLRPASATVNACGALSSQLRPTPKVPRRAARPPQRRGPKPDQLSCSRPSAGAAGNRIAMAGYAHFRTLPQTPGVYWKAPFERALGVLICGRPQLPQLRLQQVEIDRLGNEL